MIGSSTHKRRERGGGGLQAQRSAAGTHQVRTCTEWEGNRPKLGRSETMQQQSLSRNPRTAAKQGEGSRRREGGAPGRVGWTNTDKPGEPTVGATCGAVLYGMPKGLEIGGWGTPGKIYSGPGKMPCTPGKIPSAQQILRISLDTVLHPGIFTYLYENDSFCTDFFFGLPDETSWPSASSSWPSVFECQA